MFVSRAATTVGAVVVLAMALISCAEEETFDPSGSAERGIHDQVMVELGLDSEVTCTEPATTDVGATFECLATDDDGRTYRFVAQIMPDEVIGTRLD